MKSGTTSLRHSLKYHKAIHLPNKELQFFSRKVNFDKGLSWYQSKILENSKPDAIVFGEKTPAYSFYENSAKWISETCPNAKIVWIFRNPVDRTYSNYLHNKRYGEEIHSFRKAIMLEEKRLKNNRWKCYRFRSIYHLQVERYLEFFPIDQMFFMLFEDLIQPYNDDHVLNDLFEFLGVSKSDYTDVKEPRNKAIIPRFPWTLYYARKFGWDRSDKVKKLLHNLNFKNREPGYPKLDQNSRQELANFFKPHNEKLEKLIGKDLSRWNS